MLDRVFRPGSIGTLTLPHRIVMGSMHLGIEDADDGGRALAAFYAARAAGGAGLIVTGGAAVSRVGAGGRHYGFINEAADRARFAHVAEQVHAAGGLIALQLFHAGRYARKEDFGLQPVAPSAVPSRFSPDPPRALGDADIAATIADFAVGAAAARDAGFDAVEIMGSEGYLLNEFVSPITNLRNDMWGGDALRRKAFPMAVLSAIREEVGRAFPVIYRMSGADLIPGSTTPEETVALARALVACGADALNIGIGWHESKVPTVQLMVPAGTWTAEAQRIKAAVGDVPVISGNRINHLEQAEELLRGGAADFVSMARPFLADPAIMDAGRRGRVINVCIGCDQACIDRSLVDEKVSCLVNPAAGHETDLRPTVRGRGSFVVIGGGPAGLSAARELAECGQRVVLYEAEGELGGQFRLARMVPGKQDYGGTIVFYAAELARLGVDVRLAARIGAADTGAFADADGVILATGVRPRTVNIAGADGVNVLDYQQAFAAVARSLAGDIDCVPAGLRVRGGALGDGAARGHARLAIVGGGGIGIDLAHLVSRDGVTSGPVRFRAEHELDALSGGRQAGPAENAASRVTIMCRSERMGANIGRTMRWALLAELRRSGVRLMTGVRYRQIDAAGVHVDEAVSARPDAGAGPGGGAPAASGAADGTLPGGGRAIGTLAALAPTVVDADTVVIAAGQEPEAALAPTLREACVAFRTIGGARDTRRLDAVRAFSEGVTIARELMCEVGVARR